MSTTLTWDRSPDQSRGAPATATTAADHDAQNIIGYDVGESIPDRRRSAEERRRLLEEELDQLPPEVPGQTVFAVTGLKGGVGKTTFSMFLSAHLSTLTVAGDDGEQRPARVVLVDADPSSQSAEDWAILAERDGGLPFEVDARNSSRMGRSIRKNYRDFDYVVVDCGGENERITAQVAQVCHVLFVIASPRKAEARRIAAAYFAADDAIEKVGRGDDVTGFVVFTRVKKSRDQGDDSHNARMRAEVRRAQLPLMDREVPDLVEYEDAFGTVPTRLGAYRYVFEEMDKELGR